MQFAKQITKLSALLILALFNKELKAQEDITIDNKYKIIARYHLNKSYKDQSDKSEDIKSYTNSFTKDSKGIANSAYELNGKNNYLDIDVKKLGKEYSIFFEFMICENKSYINKQIGQKLISKLSNEYPFPNGWELEITNDLNLAIGNGVTGHKIPSFFEIGKWYYLAINFFPEKNEIEVYPSSYDPIKINNFQLINNSKPIRIGARSNNNASFFFSGAVDNIIISEKILKPEDVKSFSSMSFNENIEKTEKNSEFISEISKENTQWVTNTPNLKSSDINIDCKTCNEAIKLYSSAYKMKIGFSTYEFYRMKSLVNRCLTQYSNSSCIKDVSEITKELLNVNTYANDGPYKLYYDFKDVNINYILNATEVMADFKYEIEAQKAPTCKECVSTYEELFKLYKINANIDSSSLKRLKLTAFRCKYQNLNKCDNKKIDAIFEEMSNINSYDRNLFKWKLDNYAPKIIDLKVASTNIENKNFQLYKKEELLGVMNEGYFAFVPPIYAEIKIVKINNQIGILVKNTSNKYGLLNNRGENILDTIYDNLKVQENANNLFISYKKNNKWGVINYNMTTFPTKYDSIEFCKNSRIIYHMDGLYGYLNQKGVEISKPIFSKIDQLNYNSDISNIEIVRSNNKFGIIDSNANFIIEPKFDKIEILNNSLSTKKVAKFYIKVKKDSKVGYFNEFGNILIEPKYDTILNFISGDFLNAFFESAGKWGLLDKTTGAELSPAKYDEIIPMKFQKNFYKYRIKSKYGVLSKGGKEVTEVLYDSIVEESESNLRVKQNTRFGIIDYTGRIVIPIEFDKIEDFKNDYQKVSVKQKFGLYSKAGKNLISCQCDSIDLEINNPKLNNTGLCLIGNKIKLYDIKNGDYLSGQDRILIEKNKGVTLFSQSRKEKICDLKLSLPVTTWKVIDNREFCDWCPNGKYRKYSVNNAKRLLYEKRYSSSIYLSDLLQAHFDATNADEEHREFDRSRENKILYDLYGTPSDDYEGMALAFGVGMRPVVRGLSKLFDSILGKDIDLPELKYGEIPRYTEISKYCSDKCEWEARRR